nr:MAG TPA: hypothetical protein [Caudoviricetes sp.]
MSYLLVKLLINQQKSWCLTHDNSFSLHRYIISIYYILVYGYRQTHMIA